METIIVNLRDRAALLAALLLASALLSGALGCSLPPPPDSWVEEDAGARSQKPAVRTKSVLSDEEMEQFLLNASNVTTLPATISSSTFPMVLEVKWNGEIRSAIFKYKESEPQATGRPDRSGVDANPAESYRYEVAAYHLDRLLGLEMVPVAVIRSMNTDGALIQWIPDAFTEEQLEAMGKQPSAPEQLIQQQSVMRLFDAWIHNPDRKETDQLVTPADWRLHLIDHSRAFGTSLDLAGGFTSRRASLPRSLLKKLETVDEASLKRALARLVSDSQIAALLKRRDMILAKIESDRRRHGDAAVFQD